jgi:hypothetical protein
MVKLENNWLSKTLENLEGDYWGEPEYDSHLVTTCHKLRKKQLKDFETEDLRIMIGQNIGLKYLIPLAIETLQKNILADGDLYEGDLLKAVLTSEKDYWRSEVENWEKVCKLFNQKRELLQNCFTIKEIRDDWFESFADFEKIN